MSRELLRQLVGNQRTHAVTKDGKGLVQIGQQMRVQRLHQFNEVGEGTFSYAISMTRQLYSANFHIRWQMLMPGAINGCRTAGIGHAEEAQASLRLRVVDVYPRIGGLDG